MRSVVRPGGLRKLRTPGEDVGAPGNRPAIPRDEKERRFIEDAKRKGLHTVRDPNGELIAAPNYPVPGRPKLLADKLRRGVMMRTEASRRS